MSLDTDKLYLFHVWKDHGLPCTIVSDRGPQFASQVMMDLCKRPSISPKLSTAHHPQTDGQMEVMNQEVQQYLRLFCADEQEHWADWLGLAQFAINNRQHLATKFSPFQLTCTYTPRMGIEHHMAKAPTAEEFTDRLTRTYDNLVKDHSHILTQMNHSCSDAPSYAIGDQVWLSTDNLRLPRASRKLSERWLGPYSITKLVGTNTIKLCLLHSICIHLVINISHVKPYHDRCCTRSARHGTLFPFPFLALILCLCADGCCRADQARLCHKCCRHVIGLGPYLLSMTSSPSALVAVLGFSSFHFRFAPLISAPFAIRRW